MNPMALAATHECISIMLPPSRHFNPSRRPWRWKCGPPHLFTLFLSCLVTVTHITAECPILCECKWKNGKESVICSNASLTLIPSRLDAGTQVLDLTDNSLGHIARDAFLKADLLNLQKVYLAKCKIKTMDRYAFRKLKNLIELDLSYNLLPAIPSHVFDTMSALRELKLSGNPIQRVLNDAFIHVPQLVRLELADCRLGTVEPKAFSGIDHTLEWLKLDRNRLVDVRSSTLTSMRNLHGLELTGNPWNCTCGIRPLREWMLRQNIPYTVPPICRHPPRLAGKSWARLDLDEFACVPEVTAPQALATGVEGRNVTMSCRVGGIPEPSVRWLWRNRVIANLSGVPFTNGRKLYVVHVTGFASSLTILTADVQDAGVYVCSAENKAGKVEASVTLSVHRRPPDTTLSGRVLAASIVVATLFALTTCLVVLCVCNVKRRQQHGRWPTPGTGRSRDDSYEKIEMNHKTGTVINHTGANNAAASGNSALPSSGMEVAVVGSTVKRKRLGQYRGVPSVDTDIVDEDEEEGGYEDEMETPTPTTVMSGRDASWPELRSPMDKMAFQRILEETRCSRPLQETTDLHIPRASEYLDHRSDIPLPEGSTFHEGSPDFSHINTQNHVERSGRDSGGLSTISTNFRSDVTPVLHHVMKQLVGNNGGSLFTSALPDADRSSQYKHDKNYPDLLEISKFNLPGAGGMESSYCTLPRRRPASERGPVHGVARHYRCSDSQSPLLPDSRYGSIGGEGSSSSNSSIRRSSIEAYTSTYYPLATIPKQSIISHRSSSSLSLTSPGVLFNDTLASGTRPRKIPSLPSSPIHEQHSATPLLNLISSEQQNTRTSDFLRDNNMYPSPTSSTSTAPSTVTSATAFTYDYHATQLERFLEEYRSLQEQLCKMKETCENIRHQDSCDSTLSGDALLCNSNMLTSSSSEDNNPKSILKKSALVSVTASSGGTLMSDSALSNATLNYGADLSPYWLPRKTLLRRFSGGDFFQS